MHLLRAMLPVLFGVLMLAERVWKHIMVVCFFRQSETMGGRMTPDAADPGLVSILQPILSGDPTLSACLERNLQLMSRYPLEYIWLVDTDDGVGQRICQDLIARYPERTVQLIMLPPPAERENPKMMKLIVGVQAARGEVLCILDDDTQLPDNGLELCLPFLDQPGVGLAFGLPYYLNFSNVWSSLVAYFVNSNSLLTYIPYTILTQPFTINGMFYAVRREVLDAVGGFVGIEQVLADDFAVAQRFRSNGYRLAQTPLCHGISTHVTGPRHYLSLIQRWFIFPRESLLRHLGWRDRAVLYGLGMAPAFFPLLLIAWFLARPSRPTAWYGLLYFGYSFAIFAHLNRRYLRGASPWRSSWWVPILQIIFPIQLLIALLSPQRITWRGHSMEAQRGGTLRFVRRRKA